MQRRHSSFENRSALDGNALPHDHGQERLVERPMRVWSKTGESLHEARNDRLVDAGRHPAPPERASKPCFRRVAIGKPGNDDRRPVWLTHPNDGEGVSGLVLANLDQLVAYPVNRWPSPFAPGNRGGGQREIEPIGRKRERVRLRVPICHVRDSLVARAVQFSNARTPGSLRDCGLIAPTSTIDL